MVRVFATCAGATVRALCAILVALTVVLEAARLFAVAAARWR